MNTATSSSSPVAWVVVADEAIARILARSASGDTLEPVEELTDADAHADGTDLRRDALGRRSTASTNGPRSGPTSVTASAGEDEQHQEARAFAKRVARRLEEARVAHRYVSLYLFAAPRFLGLLRQEMGPQVAALVSGSSNKDLVHASDVEILRRLQQSGDD